MIIMSNVKKGVQYSVTQQENIRRKGKPSKGVTSARLVNTANDVVDIVNNSKVPIAVVDTSKYQLPNTYHAVTSCLVTDEFDEAKGMDVAKRKLLLKYNADKLDMIDVVLADLEVVRNRLLRQRNIISSRMDADKAFLHAEVHGE